MPLCSICGEELPDGSRTCAMCGTSMDDFLPPPAAFEAAAAAAAAAAAPTELPPGGSYCPVCVRVYGPGEMPEGFCSCGTELLNDIPVPAIVEDMPMAAVLDDEVPMAPVLDDLPGVPPPLAEMDFSLSTSQLVPPTEDPAAPTMKVRSSKPAPGTPCLVLYGPDKLPLQYFALTKDTMLIGRLDAVAGNFPDIDLDEWFDRATIRKISRQHALILRSRASKTFSLRPLVANTGTQLEGNMVASQQDYPLKPGSRIILGGVIRLKFEIA